MRAKLPDTEGFIERDGVKLFYEIYGDGPETIFRSKGRQRFVHG